MGWDGSGNVTRNDGTNQQANNCELQSLSGDKRINPVKMDAEFNNLADAIEATLHRGGQNAMIANLPIGGNRITGLAPSVNGTDAVNRDELNTKLNTTGGTLTGPLAMSGQKITGIGNGTDSGDVVNKGQLDTKLNLAGGTLTGALAMSGQKITGIGNGTDSGDAVNKGQLDAKLNLSGGTLTGTLTTRAITPSTHDAYDLGSASVRWRDIYCKHVSAATASSGGVAANLKATDANYIGVVNTITTDRSSSSSFSFLVCASSAINPPSENYSGGDTEFLVRGDGNVFCDGAFSGGGADFAELMETKEESLPYGIALTVDRDGYVIAMTDENQPLLGIHRPKESVTVLGNNPIEWPQKWLRDEQGKILRNARGERRLNPAYRNPGPEFIERVRPGRDNVLERVMEKNPDYSPYIPRIDRPEWVAVGIAGLVAVRKDTFKKPSWVRIKELSAEVDLYKIGG